MNILKWMSVFLFIIYSQKISAQEAPIRSDINNAYLTFDNFALFIFESPRYTFGYVKPIHRRWMVGMDLGYGNSNIIPSYHKSSLYIDDKYQLIEVRPRIYFKLKPSSKFQPFISVELFYINHRDHFVNNTDYLKSERYIRLGKHREPEDPTVVSYDSADYIRHKAGVNFNIGVFLTFVDNFGMNLDVGLGIRNRFVNYKNVVNPMAFRPAESDRFVESPITYPIGNVRGANVSMNAKLFYKFDNF